MIADVVKGNPFTPLTTTDREDIAYFFKDNRAEKSISEEYIKKVFNEGFKASNRFKNVTLDALVYFLSNQTNSKYQYENWDDFVIKEGKNSTAKKVEAYKVNFAQLPQLIQKEINDTVWQRLRPDEETPIVSIPDQSTGYNLIKKFSYFATNTGSYLAIFLLSIQNIFAKVKTTIVSFKIAAVTTGATILIGGGVSYFTKYPSIIMSSDAHFETNRKVLLDSFYTYCNCPDSISFPKVNYDYREYKYDTHSYLSEYEVAGDISYFSSNYEHLTAVENYIEFLRKVMPDQEELRTFLEWEILGGKDGYGNRLKNRRSNLIFFKAMLNKYEKKYESIKAEISYCEKKRLYFERKLYRIEIDTSELRHFINIKRDSFKNLRTYYFSDKEDIPKY